MNGVLEGEGVAAGTGGEDRFAIDGSGFELKSGSARDKDDLIKGNGDVDDIADAAEAIRGGGVDASDGGSSGVFGGGSRGLRCWIAGYVADIGFDGEGAVV